MTLASLTATEKDSRDKNLGVYRVHECIDEKFILHRFGDKTVGDLWKCTYTNRGPADMTNYELENRVGVEDEFKDEFYPYDKKTNKKKDKTTGLRDFSSIKNFITALNEPDAKYDALIDVEQFAKFEAINYILGNPDCIRNNYNNYYLYFRPSDGKAIIIPYDYDRCLGITADWNPTNSASMYIMPYSKLTAAKSDWQCNPLYNNLIVRGAPAGAGSVLMNYRDNLIKLKNSQMLTAAAFNAYKEKFKQRYGSRVYTGERKSEKENSKVDHSFDNNYAENVSYGEYIKTKLETLNDSIDEYGPIIPPQF